MRSAFYSALMILFLGGCTSASFIRDNSLEKKQPAGDPVSYSVIFHIHGDSDYLFHDSNGDSRQADREALEKAVHTAEKAASGEVFIFHQRRQKKWLGLFPRKNSVLYHFRNGAEINRVTYRYKPDSAAFLQKEAELYHRYRTGTGVAPVRRYFLYFGHEIPNRNGFGYHTSLPGVNVTTETFTGALRGFLGSAAESFGLVVVSTCSNGTPQMVKHLGGTADVLLASPQNLHLSHIDTGALQLLENSSKPSSAELADAMAGQTFSRLKDQVRTEVTLAVYDLDATYTYIEELYGRTLDYETAENPDFYRDNIDCAEVFSFDEEKYRDGVTIRYRPPAFGRRASTEKHSGWGCKGKS